VVDANHGSDCLAGGWCGWLLVGDNAGANFTVSVCITSSGFRGAVFITSGLIRHIICE